ncbi:hypothetical protein Pmani_013323 [Petrolisthes manimaculis]|uniref:Uncharacterized protein n=1 Tax=Petrolisthes manimaculis TaxID=1843537 RepID=A0AAE1PVD0_9EUCA|nr:hypothetical protein Pmani_013323 [Petrolisthes manimaculis]
MTTLLSSTPPSLFKLVTPYRAESLFRPAWGLGGIEGLCFRVHTKHWGLRNVGEVVKSRGIYWTEEATVLSIHSTTG